MNKSRRNELEDLRYGLSNHETLKLHSLCISLTLKARKISENELPHIKCYPFGQTKGIVDS